MSVVLKRAVPVLAALTLSVSLAACGSADEAAKPGASSSKAEAKKKPTAGALYKQLRASSLAAKSGHVKGNVSDEGETMAIDLAGAADGSNMEATFGAKEGTFTLRAVAGKYWIKGDEKYWTTSVGADAAKAVGAKWLAVPPGESKGMDDTTLKSLLTEMFGDEDMSKLESLTTEVGTGTLSGVDTYVLTDKIGDSGQLITTADDKAQLLKIVGPKGQPSQLTFSEWDAVKPFTAPKAADVFTP